MKSAAKRPWGERLIASPWRIILFPLWLLYRPIIGIRNTAYNLNWFRPLRLSKPVISVGNIIAGGSGKTPFVIMLCELLQAHQCHILSRGYKGDANGNDEARLMPVPVHCDSKRFRSGRQAIKDGAELLILDDGFQHRQLHRDVDIVLIDATRPWGSDTGQRGAVLPLGLLREHPRSLQRADILIVSKSDQVSEESLSKLDNQLQRFAKPILHAEHRPTHLSQLPDSEQINLETLAGRKVLCVSGIAHPQAFETSVHAQAYEVVGHLAYPDHHHFTKADIQRINEQAQQLDAVVLCTSKDAVKIAALWDGIDTELYVLHIEMLLCDADRTTLKNHIEQIINAD